VTVRTDPEPPALDTAASPNRRVASLDGIRAVAVIAVMMFHFGQGWIPGGYIGVDVFFVLSGFLITTLLVQRAPQPFAVRRFWERRIRRLFPALSLMLAVVFLYALTVPALEQTAIRGQGLATIFYVNNWYLLFSGSTYFAAYQQPSPLLHTWTLSVEEQFYILLPVILLIVIALRRFTWRPLIWLLAVMAVMSFGWTAWLAEQGASVERLYFGTDTRAQQLLLGSLLAVVGARSVASGRPRMAFAGARGGFAGLCGLSMLLAMFILWPEGRLVAVQLPVAAMGSVLLIIGALDRTSLVGRWLSWTPLAAIGVISYGLYLWHWPIAVMIGADQTNATTPVRLLLTVSIATASYIWLEKPIRQGRLRLRWLMPVPVILVIMAVVCTPLASQTVFAKALPDHAAPPYSGTGPAAFFVGDSVSGSLWLPATVPPRDDIAITGSFLLGCPLFGLTVQAAGAPVLADDPAACDAWEQQWRADMQSMKPELGVFVGTSSFQFDVYDENGMLQAFGSQGYVNRIRQALDLTLRDFSSERIVITSVPCTALPSNVINNPKNDRTRTQFLNDLLRTYAEEHGYSFVDLDGVTCVPDPSDLYIDGLHFSPEGSAKVWDTLRPRLQQLTG